jgi:Tfp pilus assembly protein PilN
MPKNKNINLLPQEQFETSTLGRALRWATGTFRIIVIITEMVVMGAFLSRFWLDAQNSDLNDSIKVKSAQISAQSETEKQFRNIQTKLDIFKQIKGAAQPSQIIDLVTSKIPSDTILTAVSTSENSALVRGISESELGIAQFVANLKGEPSFKNVELGQLSSSENNPSQTVFSIKISY